MRLDEILDTNKSFGFRVLDASGVVIKYVFDLDKYDAEAMAQHYQIRYFRPGREDTLNYRLQIMYCRRPIKEFWMDEDGEINTKLISRK